MSDAAVVQTPVVPAPTRQAVASANPAVQSSARWFWWITGLSLVNIVLGQMGNHTSFVIGLAIPAVADVLFASAKAIGFTIDALVLGFFFFMGQYASRGKLWAFVVGAVVYVLDAVIYLAAGDFMSAGFHALALFFIVRGALALRGALRSAGIR